jgi:predicted transcriptional regulator
MGYIARNLTTNKVFYSKGANKIADLVGCNYSTITKHFQNSSLDKVIKGYIVSKTVELLNKGRGTKIKSMFYGKNSS